MAAAAPFPLGAYLARVGLPAALAGGARPAPTRRLLAEVMAAHSRSITFENLDVVLRRPVDMSLPAVVAKLVGPDGTSRRGGYCFETNTLLAAALRELGFGVTPLLCRTRWNKEPGVVTPYTHLALRVRAAAPGAAAADAAAAAATEDLLADVGFAGTNGIEPVSLSGAEEALPEGLFRVVPAGAPHAGGGYSALQWHLKGAWRDLYVLRLDEPAAEADMAVANFWSYASPAARFPTQFFVQRVVADAGRDERHHVLNDVYVVRRGGDGAAETVEEVVREPARLRELLAGVFGLDAPAGAVEAWAERYRRPVDAA